MQMRLVPVSNKNKCYTNVLAHVHFKTVYVHSCSLMFTHVHIYSIKIRSIPDRQQDFRQLSIKPAEKVHPSNKYSIKDLIFARTFPSTKLKKIKKALTNIRQIDPLTKR